MLTCSYTYRYSSTYVRFLVPIHVYVSCVRVAARGYMYVVRSTIVQQVDWCVYCNIVYPRLWMYVCVRDTGMRESHAIMYYAIVPSLATGSSVVPAQFWLPRHIVATLTRVNT